MKNDSKLYDIMCGLIIELSIISCIYVFPIAIGVFSSYIMYILFADFSNNYIIYIIFTASIPCIFLLASIPSFYDLLSVLLEKYETYVKKLIYHDDFNFDNSFMVVVINSAYDEYVCGTKKQLKNRKRNRLAFCLLIFVVIRILISF